MTAIEVSTIDRPRARQGAQRRPERFFPPVAVAACGFALLAWAVWMRVRGIDHLPGINGDEAWSGVQAVRLLRGGPVDWLTPTGNPLNIFYIGPLALVHALFPPSFTLLRSVAVASGLAAIAVNYVLCRRAFDAATARVSTLLLAALPVNIAYSRFGWDASQTVLSALPVVYLPLATLVAPRYFRRYMLAAALAYMIAIVVHPTNLLLGPMLLVPFTDRLRSRFADRFDLKLVAGFLAAGTVAGLGAVTFFDRWSELSAFFGKVAQLFSGRTVYRYICDADGSMFDCSAGWAGICLDSAAWAIAVAAFVAIVRLGSRRDKTTSALLSVATLAALAAFFVVAGPRALEPGFERYGMWIVVPVVVLVARGLSLWLESLAGGRRPAALCLCLLAGLLLGTFECSYFSTLEASGGRAHLTFRTAAVEPKLQALEYLRSRRSGGQHLSIRADDWWLHWPLRYLALSEPGMDVLPIGLPDEGPRGTPVYRVEFSGEPRNRMLPTGNMEQWVLQKSIVDASGRELIRVERERRYLFHKDRTRSFDKGLN